MKIKELREKFPQGLEVELKKLASQSQDRLRELRFKVSSKQLKNVREIRRTKKTTARILTLLKERSTSK